MMFVWMVVFAVVIVAVIVSLQMLMQGPTVTGKEPEVVPAHYPVVQRCGLVGMDGNVKVCNVELHQAEIIVRSTFFGGGMLLAAIPIRTVTGVSFANKTTDGYPMAGFGLDTGPAHYSFFYDGPGAPSKMHAMVQSIRATYSKHSGVSLAPTL